MKLSRLLTCALLLCAGCARKKAADEKEAPAPVKLVSAEKQPMAQWTELVGATQPLAGNFARITLNIEGRIISFERPEGSTVKKGDVIARLDDTLAQANYAKREATAAELEQQVRQAQLTVDKADVELTNAEKLAHEPLDKTPLVSQPALMLARIARRDAESRRLEAVARQQSLKAELKALKAELEYYTIRAPIDGKLGQYQVTLGQSLPKGTILAEVVNTKEIEILCSVSPSVAGRLAVGQEARLAHNHYAFYAVGDAAAAGWSHSLGIWRTPVVMLPLNHGTVSLIDARAHPQTGNFDVKVRFTNMAGKLPLNLVTHVEVQTQPERECAVIPLSALMEDQKDAAVIVVEEKKDDKGETKVEAHRLLAKVGLRDNKVVEILSLRTPPDEENKSEEVALEGARFVERPYGLKDGDEVKSEEK